MTHDRFEPKAGLDRLSTSDEVRAAISFLPDYVLECAKATLHEVPSDMGGYINIDPEEIEIIALVEHLDERPN
jgi:hypothetical protein